MVNGLSWTGRFRYILRSSQRQVHVMLSNSATEYIEALYSSQAFTIIQVQAGRAVSSKAETRGKLTELLVVNYPVERAVQLELFERQEQMTA